MSRTVDLDQLTADVYDLTGPAYTEHPTAGTRDRATASLDRRLTAVLRALQDLDVQFDHDLPIPASCAACREPWTARSLLATYRQILSQQQTLQAPTVGAGGLLNQLTRTGGRVLTSPAGGERIHAAKPGSRPPATLAPADLLALIEAAVWTFDADLRDALDDHLDVDRPWQQALTALPALCRRLPDPEHHTLTVALAREVQSWRRTCRVLLGYTGGTVKLANDCPLCAQQSLRVSADMDTDITCTSHLELADAEGRPLLDRDGEPLIVRCFDPDTGETTRWSRQAWSQLLDAQHLAGLVTTEAAALLVRVEPATVRQWKARGFLSPTGGTARHPLWLRSEVERVAADRLAAAAVAVVPGQRSALIAV